MKIAHTINLFNNQIKILFIFILNKLFIWLQITKLPHHIKHRGSY